VALNRYSSQAYKKRKLLTLKTAVRAEGHTVQSHTE